MHEGLTIDGELGDLSYPLLHFSHLTIERFIAKLNAYTEIEARTLKAAGQSVGLGRALLGALDVRRSRWRDLREPRRPVKANCCASPPPVDDGRSARTPRSVLHGPSARETCMPQGGLSLS